MLALGTEAPSFSLPNVTDGSIITLNHNSKANAFLIAFVCNHCPYVVHLRERFAALGNAALGNGCAVFAISANDSEKYPADSPELMAAEARSNGYAFPYLHDQTQEIAKAYKAACTPDFFLFDTNRKLVYRGQFDGSRPGNGQPVTGDDLQNALDSVTSGQRVTIPQQPSLGCNIKWRPGNAPEYFE